MNADPSHEELLEMLPAAALEILDSADLQRVLAHARDCSECTGLLSEYREAAAALALALPLHQPDPERSAALRSRLLARARQHRHGGPGKSKVAVSLADRWSGWLVAAALSGLLVTHHAIHRPLAYGWLAAGVLTMALVALAVYARIQRGRRAELEDRVAALEQERTGGEQL